MELSWELERLGRAAAPDVVLEGRNLVHRVSDVLRNDDGSVDAHVRGEHPHTVSIAAGFPHYGFSCTCGAARFSSACSHVIAVRLRVLQMFHGLDDARTARWERHVESLRSLQTAWSALADVWLEAFRDGDDTATGAVLRDAGSLHSALEVARALGDCATVAEQSAFLLRTAAHHDVDGTVPLEPWAITNARHLAESFWTLRQHVAPEACTDLLLAVAGSSRRAGIDPDADWRVEHVFTSACRALGQVVTDGHADPSIVAAALLDAELGAPATNYPWSAVMVDALDVAAPRVASSMREQLSARQPDGGWASADEPHFRLRAELVLAEGGASGVIAVLEEWLDAPYDEFLRRLPLSTVPTARIAFLEAAHRNGRTAWSPGWAPRPPEQQRRTVLQLHRSPGPTKGTGNVAIGELVLAEALIGRTDVARDLLCEHAQRHPDLAHRYEFHRIWAAAKLGPGAEERATEIFGSAEGNETLTELLTAVSRIPGIYFNRELTRPDDGLCTVLLTAILLEDIPSEGHARNLDAPTWARSILSWYSGAADDLDAFASLPVTEIADELEGAVLDRRLALRTLRIAGQIIESSCSVRSMADLRELGAGRFIDVLDRLPDAKPLTAALLALLLGAEPRAALEQVRTRFLRNALTGDVPGDSGALLELAHSTEPRCADARAYQLAIVLAELDGRTPYWRVRG